MLEVARRRRESSGSGEDEGESGGKEVRGGRVVLKLENRASTGALAGCKGTWSQGHHVGQSRAVTHMREVDRCWSKGPLPVQRSLGATRVLA